MARGASKFDSKFKSVSPSDSRKVNVRNERSVKEDMPKITFNFKDFDQRQCPPGQTFEQWEEKGGLSKLMRKFVDVCQYNIIEAKQMGLLKVYGKFPEHSEFHEPSFIEGEVEWGTIQKIGGQKPRLAGYIIGSVFYPVFLDREHKFYPTKKK